MESELLAAVYAAPDDDGARLVLQDYLLEKEDPRGEWMVLQFKRASGVIEVHEAERERRLLAQHGDAWLGELAPAVARRDRVFKKGFLSGGTVTFSGLDEKRKLIAHPAWRTVERLAGDVDLITRPELWLLSSIGPIAPDRVEPLAKRTLPPKVDELRIAVGSDFAESDQERIGRLAELDQIRRVRIEFDDTYFPTPLALQPSVFAALLSSRLIGHLESLSLRRRANGGPRTSDDPDDSLDLRSWLAIFRMLPALKTIHLVPSPSFGYRVERRASGFALIVDLLTEFAAGHPRDFRRGIVGERARDFVEIRLRQWGTVLTHHENVFQAFASELPNLRWERAGAL